MTRRRFKCEVVRHEIRATTGKLQYTYELTAIDPEVSMTARYHMWSDIPVSFEIGKEYIITVEAEEP